MAHAFTVELLHGLVEDGRRHTLAELREPSGHDEARFAEFAHTNTAERVSALLAALVLRIGDCERPSEDKLNQLTAGDRERLLFAVSARLLGSRLDLVMPCPCCQSLVEIPVKFEDLIAIQPETTADHIMLQARNGHWAARCRPPNGADLEKAARLEEQGARQLIVDCITELIDPSGNRAPANALPAECEADMARALAELDPAAECHAAIVCPACAGTSEAVIDGFTILRTAMGGAQRLYEDVYQMARAYHWSEADILSLPLRRRRRYLAIAENAGVPQ